MKGYYIGFSYVGFMPDGTKRMFATETEYKEAYMEERSLEDEQRDLEDNK